MEWELLLGKGLVSSVLLGFLFLCMACKAQTSYPLQARHHKRQLETVMTHSRLFLDSSWKIMETTLIKKIYK